MSRIRGIETKVQQNEVLQTHRNGLSDNNNKKKNEDQNTCPKDVAEKRQIADLLAKLPRLDAIFSVHRKIGEGTFSTVYLGSLRRHEHLPPAQRRWFALKHLVPTAHPARVEHELRCLRDMGGKNNVIGVDLCLRHFDTIVFVMPYIPHKKFSEYVGEMDASEVREYMRALLTALRHVHSFGVIHRDIKPSNFLYDREHRRYLLVDFGLAQRVVAAPPPAPAPAPPPAHNASKRPRDDDEEETVPCAKRVALDLTVRRAAAGGGVKAVAPSPAPAHAPAPHHQTAPAPAPTPPGPAPLPAAASPKPVVECACSGVGGVCGACSGRAAPRAPRAGTQGFRPPEVLLKVVMQTTAVDVWAAGVVLASLLSARYPFFRAGDDAAALAELADLLGTKPLADAARLLGRRLVTSVSRGGLCLRKLCAHLRGAPPPPHAHPAPAPAPPCARCRLLPVECLCRDETVPPTAVLEGAYVAGFPDAAFALAASLLQPLPSRRPSAAQALHHPFLACPPSPTPAPAPAPCPGPRPAP